MNKRNEMRKTITLFLVFSILLLSGNMFAKERKGADLIVQKIDGLQIRGELIAVKQNSILLMERNSGADVTIEVSDISKIKIVNKSKSVFAISLGIAIGGALGTLAGYEGSRLFWAFDKRKTWAWIGGIIGMVSGALIGSFVSAPKTIRFLDKSDTEIQEIHEELRKKARIKNAR
jgi:hypothetical protein